MATWEYGLIVVLQLVGLLALVRVFFGLLVNSTWGPVVVWGMFLIGSTWFVWSIISISRWYLALKQRLGLPRVYKMLVTLNAVILLLIGLVVFIRVFFGLLVSPTWSTVVVCVMVLIGSTWFVWSITSRWYPALKQRLGLPRVYKMLVTLNALAWLPGFWFARYVLNTLTGVDAANFTTALWVFTLGGIVYVWLLLIVICLGLMALISMVTASALATWENIRSFFVGLTTLSAPQPRPTRVGHHLMNAWAFMCVIFLPAIVVQSTTMRHTVKSLANFALVMSEFSHDRTCAASSATRWVAPLKDRKELKVSNVLIANWPTGLDIQFSIGQCQKVETAIGDF